MRHTQRNKRIPPDDYEETSADYIVGWQWNGKNKSRGHSEPLTRDEAEIVRRAKINEDPRLEAHIIRRRH